MGRLSSSPTKIWLKCKDCWMNANITIVTPFGATRIPIEFFFIKHPSTIRLFSIIIVLSKDAKKTRGKTFEKKKRELEIIKAIPHPSQQKTKLLEPKNKKGMDLGVHFGYWESQVKV